MSPLIREATQDDLAVLLEIEQECFSHPHWRPEDFTSDNCQVAEIDCRVAGFVVSKEVFAGDDELPSEREILNLAVRPNFRRRGIASALLRRLLKRETVYFLEVRESNIAAQALYQRFGFKEIGRRTGYYHSPIESAIVMRMKWC